MSGANDAALPLEHLACFIERDLGFLLLACGDEDVCESAHCLTCVVDGCRSTHDLDGFTGERHRLVDAPETGERHCARTARDSVSELGDRAASLTPLAEVECFLEPA